MFYESFKYYNGNLYASIAKDVKNKKLFMDLHAGIVMDVKNQQLLQDLYASIVMDVKKSTTITKPICRYFNGCKKLTIITKPICKYYNGCKKTSNYYETYMWVLHIGNGVMEIIIERMSILHNVHFDLCKP
jgi:hypothetical protein